MMQKNYRLHLVATTYDHPPHRRLIAMGEE
jgi:hypothetical protein